MVVQNARPRGALNERRGVKNPLEELIQQVASKNPHAEGQRIVKGASVGPTVPPRALALSLLALVVAGATNVLLPATMQDFSAYLWLLALVPPFLFAYYRGWEGAAAGLGAAMVVLIGMQFIPGLLSETPPDWRATGATAGVFLVFSMGIGWGSEKMQRSTFDALSLAYADALTGLGNRRVLDFVLDKHVAGVRRGIPASVAMFDLDDFKNFNDTYGHPAGDEALTLIARVLTSEARRSDLPIRTGGEEFVVVLPGTSVEGAVAYAERVRKKIAEIETTTGTRLTVSAGVAGAQAYHARAPDVLAEADAALYAAKRSGRNRVVVHGETTQRTAA
jgi:diguanylate cyclase (GGDEF)-like protein